MEQDKLCEIANALADRSIKILKEKTTLNKEDLEVVLGTIEIAVALCNMQTSINLSGVRSQSLFSVLRG